MIKYWFRKLAGKLDAKASALQVIADSWRKVGGYRRADAVSRVANLRTLAEALREVADE